MFRFDQVLLHADFLQKKLNRSARLFLRDYKDDYSYYTTIFFGLDVPIGDYSFFIPNFAPSPMSPVSLDAS